MVHCWNIALAMLLASSTTTSVTSFQSNSNNNNNNNKIINNNILNQIPSSLQRSTVETTITTKSSLTSMAADASSSFNGNDAIGEALSSVTNAAVDSIANAVKDEPDTDAQEIARKQKMVQKRQTEKTYKVTLPLAPVSMSNLGITLCQISKGRKLDSVFELNLDTLNLEDGTKRSRSTAVDNVGDVELNNNININDNNNNDNDNDNDNSSVMDTSTIRRRVDGTFQGLVVSSVTVDSAGWISGVRPGDILKTTSATLGNKMWPKSTMEGVKSAIMSRKAVAESMEFEFQRLGETVDNQFELTLTRPIGFNLQGKL